MARDMQQYAQDRISELLDIKGFSDPEDVITEIENMEDDFDPESYCPYYSQQTEVIEELDREFGDEAEDYIGEQTYKATDWQQAKTAYAYGLAMAAHSCYFSQAKDELVEGIREFMDDVASELNYDGEIKIAVNGSSALGWASHNRELSDGTMVFESRQLDGCNGMERSINGTWVSVVIDPDAPVDEDEE